MKSTCHTYFRITCRHIDPEIFTNIFDIVPSRSWQEDDPRKDQHGKCIGFYKFSAWNSPKINCIVDYSLGVQADKVIDMFYDKMDIINELKKEYDLHLSLEIIPSIYINEVTPFLEFSPKVIEFCHVTGTSMDIVWYFDCKHEDDCDPFQ